MGFVCLYRYFETEDRTLAWSAHDRNIAAHEARVATADSQSQTRPFLKPQTALELIERLEQPALFLAGQARTCVFNPRRHPEPMGTPPQQGDVQLYLSAGGEFDCIAQKVDQHLAHLTFVGHHVIDGFPVD